MLFFSGVVVLLLMSSSLMAATPERKDTALQRARKLQAPRPSLSYGGDVEDHEWWDEHESLLEEARIEYGKLHPELYQLDTHFENRFVNPSLVEAMSARDSSLLSKLINRTEAEGVYSIELFTPLFTKLILEELEHYEASGIPLRRPNSMNRYGAILSHLGFSTIIDEVADKYLQPLAVYLFPKFVLANDLQENYPFVVRYQPGQDIELAEHTDASTVTVNVCLQAANETSVLYFKGVRHVDKEADQQAPTTVHLSKPGMAVIHLGQHIHAVRPVDGERSQMVVWMFGEHGYVRVAPYSDDEIKQKDSSWLQSSTLGEEF